MSALTFHQRLIEWLCGRDTGNSSRHMAAIAAGVAGSGYWPVDIGDLGRCIRLICAVPEVKDHFPAIAASSPKWAIVIEHWDELAALYETERHFVTCATAHRMRELGL